MRRDPRLCGLFAGALLLCLFAALSAADDTSQTLSPQTSFVFDNRGQDVFLEVDDAAVLETDLDAEAETEAETEAEADKPKGKGKKTATDVATNPEHVQKQVETVGKNVDAKLTKEFDETRTVAETVGVYVTNMGKTLKTTDPVVQREFERRPRNIQYQPQVYLSKPKDWGCCRLCTSKPRPRPLKPVVIRDPSRFVNCCPFCPTPPLARNKKKGLGPYQFYFEKHYPTQNDLYEAHLVTAYKEHLPEPASRDKPYEDIKRWQIEKMAQEGIQEENSDAGLTLLETEAESEEEGPKGGSKGSAKPEEPDPYQAMRGFNMDRERNYVYGFPETPLPPEAVGVPYAGQIDLPPCCTVCTRKTHSLSLDSEQGCCVQCAVTLGNAPTWRTRRERYADEQAFKGRAGGNKKKKGGKKK